MTEPPEVHFGPTRRQHLGQVLAGPLGALVGLGVVAAAGQGVHWVTTLVVVMSVGLAGAAARASTAGAQGLTVNAYGALVRRGARESRLPWSEVREIEVRRALGTRSVRLVTPTRTLRTGYPCSYPLGRDPDFDAKVDGIRRWMDLARSS